MGILDGLTSVARRVRQWATSTRTRQARELAVGGTGASALGTGYDLLSSYGADNLSSYLQLDHGLLERYSDYEGMDEYPLVSCLAGDSLVFTLEEGWVPIRTLADRGLEFHVLAYDKATRSLVPAKASDARCTGPEGHAKPMVRVVTDDGRTITCTSDHLFLLKDEVWRTAGDLQPGDRLMPGVLRQRHLAVCSQTYWEVHQPQSDSTYRASDGKRWVWLHRLVAETLLGAVPSAGEVVHHIDENTHNNAPSNLSIEDNASHARIHLAGIDNTRFFPEWTAERRAQAAERMRGNDFALGKKFSPEVKQRLSEARKGRPKSEAHRRAIGLAQPSRVALPREVVEGALREGGTVARAARLLGVSWSTMNRRAEEFDLLSSEANHRVLRVEVLPSREPVYDLTVPGFHNFVCNGVVVHNSALDVYADDATQTDQQTGKAIWAKSKDHRVEEILNDLLHKVLHIEDERWELARTLCKHGNDYEEPIITNEGVVALNFLPAPTMRRLEGSRGELYGYVQDFRGKVGYTVQEWQQLMEARDTKPRRPPFDPRDPNLEPPGEDEYVAPFEDWEVVHFRLRGRHRRSVYGHAVLESARFIYRRLMLLEDAALIFRLQRAPEKLAFYVDVGQMPSTEALAHVRRVRNDHKKKKFINPTTGQLATRIEAFSPDADYWVPSRDGKDSTRIETVSSPSWQHMEDIEYFRSILFAAMKIPKAYLGGDEGVVNSVLSSQDVRFARTILRVQQALRQGLQAICRIHLAALGIDPNRVEFEIEMTIPSSIFELAQLEARNARADLAGRMREFVDMRTILQDVFGLSDEETLRVVQGKHQDAVRDAFTQAKVQSIMGGPGGPRAPGGAPGGPEAAPIPLTRRRAGLPNLMPNDLEKELYASPTSSRRSRQFEKKLDEVLKGDQLLAARLQEVKELVQMVSQFRRAS